MNRTFVDCFDAEENNIEIDLKSIQFSTKKRKSTTESLRLDVQQLRVFVSMSNIRGGK